MEFKALLFAGIAVFFFLVFVAVGGFSYYNATQKIEHYEEVIASYEDDTGENHHFYEVVPEGETTNHTWPAYLEAKEKQDDAENSKSLTTLWFVIAVVMLLIGLSLVAIHFILEKRADDKMGASFFMEGGDAGPGPAEENKRD